MSGQADVGYHARQHARWHWSEIAFWIFVVACAFLATFIGFGVNYSFGAFFDWPA